MSFGQRLALVIGAAFAMVMLTLAAVVPPATAYAAAPRKPCGCRSHPSAAAISAGLAQGGFRPGALVGSCPTNCSSAPTKLYFHQSDVITAEGVVEGKFCTAVYRTGCEWDSPLGDSIVITCSNGTWIMDVHTTSGTVHTTYAAEATNGAAPPETGWALIACDALGAAPYAWLSSTGGEDCRE